MASQWRIDKIKAFPGAEHIFNQEDINQYAVIFDLISVQINFKISSEIFIEFPFRSINSLVFDFIILNLKS